MQADEGEIRIDKWLWAVRLFKTRSLATAACAAGHVKVDGQPIKPARPVRVGEIISARAGNLHRTIKVTALLGRRVGAKLVPNYAEDLTPPEEYERVRELNANSRPALLNYPRGMGRPTKKQRRLMTDSGWIEE